MGKSDGEADGFADDGSNHSVKLEDIWITIPPQDQADDGASPVVVDLSIYEPKSEDIGSATSLPPVHRSISERFRAMDLAQQEEKAKRREKKEENRRRKKKHLRKQYKMHMEAVQNIRNTITVVAILIATIAFTGAVTPPGSYYQDGPLIGKPILGQTTSYKVFIICNDIALFLSLSIVLVLITIIPFRSKPLMKLLFITHKVVWAAVAFITTAYIAARWTTMYQGISTRWMFAALVAICGGLLMLVFFGLSLMLINDRLRKSKWKSRMETLKEVEDEDELDSIISDVQSNLERGYHSH